MRFIVWGFFLKNFDRSKVLGEEGIDEKVQTFLNVLVQ